MLEGGARWQREGLRRPQKVAVATSKYRREHDSVGRFVDDCCIRGGETKNMILYEAYEKSCSLDEVAPVSKTVFGKILVERGYEIRKSNGTWWREGLSLK